MKAIMYGAGSIGRGFIGALFSEIGYETVFIDVDDQVVDHINSLKTYPQIIMNEHQTTHWITNIRAINGKDVKAVSNEIADADILATAVGASVLERISPVIAQGLVKRWDINPQNSIDLLICENLMDADVLLKKWLLNALPEKYKKTMEDHLGLVETSIGRMVPPADTNSNEDHPLAVRVESYDFLPVDKAAFKGSIPNYSKIVPYAPFHYYLERKLYIHNMAHVTTAFLGQTKGFTYIDEAANDLCIRKIVQGCMTESAIMLAKKYDVPFDSLQNHIDDLLFRFRNPYLKDTIKRVAREPLRKLKPSDRLVGAARICEQQSIPPVYLSFAIALALSFISDKDPVVLLKEICEISENDQLFTHIMYFYDKLVTYDYSLSYLLEKIEYLQAEIHGEIV